MDTTTELETAKMSSKPIQLIFIIYYEYLSRSIWLVDDQESALNEELCVNLTLLTNDDDSNVKQRF